MLNPEMVLTVDRGLPSSSGTLIKNEYIQKVTLTLVLQQSRLQSGVTVFLREPNTRINSLQVSENKIKSQGGMNDNLYKMAAIITFEPAHPSAWMVFCTNGGEGNVSGSTSKCQ